MTSDNVERWRPLVRNELDRQSNPLPEDLILALIWTESRGKPGTVNPQSGASGLTQVMPKTLEWYNKQTGDSVSLDALRSKSMPLEQIRVGIWVLSQFWKSAYRYLKQRLTDIPVDELGRIADLFYVAGPGATQRRLDKLVVPFYDYVKSRWPTWNALPHVQNVWSQLPVDMPWNESSISKWLSSSDIISHKTRQGAIVMMVALIAGYWLFFRKKPPNIQSEKPMSFFD